MKIIILHGWKHNGQLWRGLANKFGNNAEAIDLPGFGKEPLIKDDWGIPQYAEWVYKKFKTDKNIIIIGHSFGGRIAAEIASKNPKNLKGLVLSGSPCIYRPAILTQLKIKIYKLLKIFLPQQLKVFFYPSDLRKSGKLEKIFRKVVSYDQTNDLKKIKIKTLIIWGEKDNQVPSRIAFEINRLILKSELKIVEGAGHNVFLEKPDLFYGYVKKFISNL